MKQDPNVATMVRTRDEVNIDDIKLNQHAVYQVFNEIPLFLGPPEVVEELIRTIDVSTSENIENQIKIFQKIKETFDDEDKITIVDVNSAIFIKMGKNLKDTVRTMAYKSCVMLAVLGIFSEKKYLNTWSLDANEESLKEFIQSYDTFITNSKRGLSAIKPHEETSLILKDSHSIDT